MISNIGWGIIIFILLIIKFAIIIQLEDMEVGFVVDSANDVLDIQSTSIEQQPTVVGSLEEEFISGVAKLDKRLLILLHLNKVLNPLG